MSPDFSWSCTDIEKIMNEYKLSNYIVLMALSKNQFNKQQMKLFNNIQKVDAESKGNKKVADVLSYFKEQRFPTSSAPNAAPAPAPGNGNKNPRAYLNSVQTFAVNRTLK